MKIFDAQWQRRATVLAFGTYAIVVVIFSVVYVRRSEAPLDAYSSLKWLALYLLGATEWLIYYSVFLSLKYNFLRWWQTLRVVGMPSRDTRNIMREVAELREHQYGMAWIPVCVCAATLGSLFFLTNIGLFLALTVLIVEQATIESSRQIVPPAVLFLTTTADDNLRLYASISFRSGRLRVVALLKVDRSITDLVSIAVRRDCFRTKSDDDWEKVVRQFMQIAPIIVLDARHSTPAVTTELNRVVDNGFSYKVVLVVGPTGERPLIDAESDDSKSQELEGVPAVRAEGVLPLVHYLTRSRQRLPSRNRSAGVIIQESGKWQFIDRTDWASR